MGQLIVIEGLDGAGKRTLANGLGAALTAQHASVARMAFPRYDADVHAELVRDALYGRLGDLAESVHGMAVLFALDRRDATDQLRVLRRRYDVVLLDRYVASNAAYGAARLHEDANGPFVEWVRGLEVDRFGVPVPDTQLLLRVPMSVAAARADRRAEADSARRKDLYETDHGLQARCAAVYDGLAAGGWLAPWSVLDGTTAGTVAGSVGMGRTGPTLSDLAVQMLDG
ncbi:MAG: dTMP kinase [Pseudonocardiales bacterium]|nr:dTMP kinase [Pseudonocardiales bacterium]MBV9729182.1 dTMP kinase [Pseudonocardiales bacterium]